MIAMRPWFAQVLSIGSCLIAADPYVWATNWGVDRSTDDQSTFFYLDDCFINRTSLVSTPRMTASWLPSAFQLKEMMLSEGKLVKGLACPPSRG